MRPTERKRPTLHSLNAGGNRDDGKAPVSEEGGELLQVKDLQVAIRSEYGDFLAVDGVSFDVEQGTMVGVVGESGCGKTLSAMSIPRLHDSRAVQIVGGQIRYRNCDLLSLSESEMRALRGAEIAVIFQDSLAALNPVQTLGAALEESIATHRNESSRAARRLRAVELLSQVRFPDPEAALRRYPHELSGGMRQRAMIAMALARTPRLLIADEPTTALDVTVQRQILDLLHELKQEHQLTVIMVTHDLALLSQYADKLVVMYAGRVVEQGPAAAIYATPRHPYTRGLLASLRFGGDEKRLQTIRGTVPDLRKVLRGCRFAGRCPDAIAQCQQQEPPIEVRRGGHATACWLTDPPPVVGVRKPGR